MNNITVYKAKTKEGNYVYLPDATDTVSVLISLENTILELESRLSAAEMSLFDLSCSTYQSSIEAGNKRLLVLSPIEDEGPEEQEEEEPGE